MQKAGPGSYGSHLVDPDADDVVDSSLEGCRDLVTFAVVEDSSLDACLDLVTVAGFAAAAGFVVGTAAVAVDFAVIGSVTAAASVVVTALAAALSFFGEK